MEKMKRCLILDGQGGGIGVQLARLLAKDMPAGWELLAVGTNAAATGAMLRAGGHRGERPYL